MSVPPEIAARVRDLVTPPPVVEELAARFERAGKQLYLVGGSVRDALLGRAAKIDYDFATDATPDEIVKICRGWEDGTWLQGVEFGTVGIQKNEHRLEVTQFRAERYDRESRNPDVVPVRTIEDDLARRDFTINAMAVRLPDRGFIDPFGGLNDLVGRTLRTPGAPEESFGDDPLRMLRAARFVAHFDLRPEPGLVTAMREMRDRLRIVSAERIRDELSKLLLSPAPSKGLALAVETGLCDLFLPELPALKLEQDPVHKHKDVYAHTLAVVDKVVASDPPGEPDLELRLAALLHDIGKPATRRITPEGVTFHHHEVEGAKMARRRLRELRFPNDQVDTITQLVEMHLRFHGYGDGWTDAAVRRYVRDAGPLLDRLNRLVRSDVTTRNRFRARQFERAMDDFEERIARLAAEEDLKRIRPPIDGNEVMRHLGIPPGPLVGEALAHLLELRLERGEYPREEALDALDAWARDAGLR